VLLWLCVCCVYFVAARTSRWCGLPRMRGREFRGSTAFVPRLMGMDESGHAGREARWQQYRRWKLETGDWTMEIGHWTLDNGD
jgi:hypothetical protein